MPGVRTKGQVLIGCWCDEKFVQRIDVARDSKSRSQFARDALLEKLQAMGISVSGLKTHSPDRKGKGRPKRKELPPVAKDAFNLMPDPNLDPKVKAAADAIMLSAAKKIRALKKAP